MPYATTCILFNEMLSRVSENDRGILLIMYWFNIDTWGISRLLGSW